MSEPLPCLPGAGRIKTGRAGSALPAACSGHCLPPHPSGQLPIGKAGGSSRIATFQLVLVF